MKCRTVVLQWSSVYNNLMLACVIDDLAPNDYLERNLCVCVCVCVPPYPDSPHLEQPEVSLLLQTVINILLPPRIISTSRTKNFMLDTSPAHCSTPGDQGKDLRREGLAESTSQAAYLGRLLTQPADSQEEITARHHIADQLERRFIPRPLCKSSLFAEFNNELKILKEAVHSGSAYQGKTSISTVGTSTSAYRLSLATMSRSNTGTGTVWEQESQPSRQPSQDTLSRTDEDDEQEQEESQTPLLLLSL
ncbi:unnamed protein product, partial [Oncorhynchus mykiss]